MACIDENTIAAYFDLTLSPEEAAGLFAHVDQCESCAQLFGECGRMFAAEVGPSATSAVAGPSVDHESSSSRAPSVPAARAILGQPKMLGRFRIERLLGLGGMGVVYAAHDPELARNVAIKLLRPGSRATDEQLRARLVREAQAMARLQHSNVITVFEVGAFEGRVFIAMELIDGSTVREWLAASKRGWRAILAAFLEAGAGLAAAHEAGLVHRDFKPDNVLMARNGRVCVTDFGLARLAQTTSPSSDEPTAAMERGLAKVSMSGTGALIGTPQYMAPEQLQGGAVDARTDIFSFCVALYEALHGVRPFAGATLHELARNVTAGEVQQASKVDVPRRVRRALLAGLSVDPSARPQTMKQLLDELEPAARPRLLRALSLGVALVVLVAVGAGWWRWSRTTGLCRGAERKLVGVWDAPRKLRLTQAFAASGRGFLSDSGRVVARILDERMAQWTAQRTDACEATHARGEQSEALLDRRIQCLDERLRETSAMVDVLSDGDAKALERAVTAASSLEPLDQCRDPPLHPLPPLEPDRRRRLDEVDALVAHAEAQRATGQYRAAAPTAAEALAGARSVAFAPTLASALFVNGQLAARAAHFDDAGERFGEAQVAAQESRDDRLAARIDFAQADLASEQEHRREQAQWLQLADGALHRLGKDSRLEVLALKYHAQLAEVQGHLDAAEADYRRALAIISKDQSLWAQQEQGILLSNLGNVLRETKRYPEAVATLRQSLAQMRAALGPDHPVVGQAMEALAVAIYLQLGGSGARVANEAALPMFRDQVALFERAYGDTHPRVANSLFNVGDTLCHLGRYDEAVPILERSVAIYSRFVDEKSAALNGPRATLGEAYVRVARFADAVRVLEPALAIDTGDEPQKRFALAQALWMTNGNRARAVALTREAKRLAQADSTLSSLNAEIDRWLRGHSL